MKLFSLLPRRLSHFACNSPRAEGAEGLAERKPNPFSDAGEKAGDPERIEDVATRALILFDSAPLRFAPPHPASPGPSANGLICGNMHVHS